MPPTTTATPRWLTLRSGRIPVRWTRTLWHRGRQPTVLTRRRSNSHEGDALSVVLEREDLETWAGIAHTRGRDWRLRRSAPAPLVDWHRLRRAKAWAALVQQAVVLGWLVPGTVWTYTYLDGDLDEEMVMTFATETDARAEFEDHEDEDVVVPLEAVATHLASPALRAWWAARFTSPLTPGQTFLTPEDVAVDRLLRDESALQGVWWEDRLDPQAYSAPRGGLWPECLAGWTIDAPR